MQEFTDKTAPYQLPLETFGIELRICTNSEDLLERVRPMIPPGWQRRPRAATQHRLGLLSEEGDVYSVYSGEICVHDAPGLDYALMMFDATIQRHVAFEAENFVFIHAGAVADGDRAIVMPGSSFAGKTTLAHALVRAGAVYYSDEFAVLDENGLVHPYPKRLSVRRPRSKPAEVQVEELGGTAGDKSLPIGMVIATTYRPGAEWAPHELSRGAGALALIENAVTARARPTQTMRVVTEAVKDAVILSGDRGEADELAGILLDSLRNAA